MHKSVVYCHHSDFIKDNDEIRQPKKIEWTLFQGRFFVLSRKLLLIFFFSFRCILTPLHFYLLLSQIDETC